MLLIGSRHLANLASAEVGPFSTQEQATNVYRYKVLTCIVGVRLFSFMIARKWLWTILGLIVQFWCIIIFWTYQLGWVRDGIKRLIQQFNCLGNRVSHNLKFIYDCSKSINNCSKSANCSTQNQTIKILVQLVYDVTERGKLGLRP